MQLRSEQHSGGANFWPLARISLGVILFACIILALLSYKYLASFENSQRFKVESLISSRSEQNTTVFTQFDLQLSNQLINAIDNGVPIYINVKYGNPKLSMFRQTYTVKESFQHRIERHALSNRYLLTDLASRKLISFESIGSALSYLGQSYKITLAANYPHNNIAVRCYVDLTQLPSPLRFKRIFSRFWRHDSDWSVWPLNS